MKTELEGIVVQELEALGFGLVELRTGGTKRRPVLDIRIEHSDGRAVTIDDCVVVSRALESRLEGSAGPSLTNYVLEVSSPGLERPLKKVADWRRFVGRDVSVLSSAVGGRREFTIAGVEGADSHEEVVLTDKAGTQVRVPLAAVKEARLVFHWKR